jgi:hypothetical protein
VAVSTIIHSNSMAERLGGDTSTRSMQNESATALGRKM